MAKDIAQRDLDQGGHQISNLGTQSRRETPRGSTPGASEGGDGIRLAGYESSGRGRRPRSPSGLRGRWRKRRRHVRGSVRGSPRTRPSP